MDFNTESMVSSSAGNIVKLLMLEARYNAFIALEFYNTKLSDGIDTGASSLKSRLGTWFLELQAYLHREKKNLIKEDSKITYEYLKLVLFESKKLDMKDAVSIFEFFNGIMDNLKITKIDTKKIYDTTDIEADNEANMYH
jgi:hypothetical protein